MSSIKQNVKQFLSKDGQSDTTVHERINPAAVHEHVVREQREDTQKVIDREVHQDHHHISVQPIVDQQQLPEQHKVQTAPTEHREIRHGDHSHAQAALEAERAQFKDTRDVSPTRIVKTQGPTVTGEHVHHHVHETIQPVIEREVFQPTAVHTTIPVHETHINEAKHHTASTLPAVSLSEFEKQGGSLSGRSERTDAFAGAPNAIGESRHGGAIGGPGAKGSTTITDREGINRSNVDQTSSHHGSHVQGEHADISAKTGANAFKNDPNVGSSTVGRSNVSSSTNPTASTTHNTSTHDSNLHKTETGKTSLLDKLNPMKHT
jgi:hypothetical protein